MKLQRIAAPDVDRIGKLAQEYKRQNGPVATNSDFEGPLKPHLQLLKKTEGWHASWLSMTAPTWRPSSDEPLLEKRRRAELYYFLLAIIDKGTLGDKVAENKKGELQLDAQALFRRIAGLLQNGAKESDSMAVQARWENCTMESTGKPIRSHTLEYNQHLQAVRDMGIVLDDNLQVIPRYLKGIQN